MNRILPGEAIVHSVENVGRTEGHVRRIELKY